MGGLIARAVFIVLVAALMVFLIWYEARGMDLVELHTLDGGLVQINPNHIVGLRTPQKDRAKRLLSMDVHCIINLADGKFLTVLEPCAMVESKLPTKRP